MGYDEVDFDVIVGSYGDCFDRYAIRLNEVRESMRIVRQILDKMPAGDYRVQDKKVTPPPRARIDESMEALIHHFKIFTEGFKVPEGEVYVGIESPRGEIGCYLVSDGSAKPYRMHIRAPSFVNLQALPHMMRGGLIADAVAVISSVDPRPGRRRSLMARLTDANVALARQIIRATRVRGRRSCRCSTSRRSRTAGSPTTRWSTSPSSSVSHRPRCSARRASTRCSSARRSAPTS